MIPQVNGQRLLGLNHVEVVNILKELPRDVRIVCARPIPPTAQKSDFVYAQNRDQFFQSSPPQPHFERQVGGATAPEAPLSDRLIKAHSEVALPVATAAATATVPEPDSPLNRLKSRSLEPLSGLAMWSSEPVVIELQKGDRGLGFSILDYQVR